MIKKIIAANLVLALLLVGGVNVMKAADTTLTLEITGGALTVSTDASATFNSVAFSFNGQSSTGNDLGDVIVEDTRGTMVGWSVDVTAADWSDGGTNTMDYDGDGSTTGQLTLDIPEIGSVTANSGNTTGLTMGTDDAFDAGTDTINLISASNGNGSGNYTIDALTADQFIPGQQAAATYTTTLTVTAS